VGLLDERETSNNGLSEVGKISRQKKKLGRRIQRKKSVRVLDSNKPGTKRIPLPERGSFGLAFQNSQPTSTGKNQGGKYFFNVPVYVQ